MQLYHEQGFVHIPRVLSAGEVATFRAASEELLDRERPEIWGASAEQIQVHYVQDTWCKHETLRGLAFHPGITGIARHLACRPLRLYASELLAKEPHNQMLPTVVHDDEAGLPLANHSATLTAWVALVDVPVERGCLTYIPGSHRRPDADRQIRLGSFAEYREMADIWPDYLWQPRITVPVRAGDVIFHHFRTVHLAGANVSDQRRLAHGLIYMDSGATYRPGVQDQHLAHMLPGQPLDGAKFPLIDVS